MTATHCELRTSLAFGRQADTIQDRDAVNKCLRSLAPSYLAELCRPVVHLTGRRVDTCGRPPPATRCATDSHSDWSQELCCFWSWDLEQLTSWTVYVDTVYGHLRTNAWKHIFVSTEWHAPLVHQILLKAALFINFIIIIIINCAWFQICVEWDVKPYLNTYIC